MNQYIELLATDDDLRIPIQVRVGLLDAVEVGTMTTGELRATPHASLADLLECVAAEIRKSAG